MKRRPHDSSSDDGKSLQRRVYEALFRTSPLTAKGGKLTTDSGTSTVVFTDPSLPHFFIAIWSDNLTYAFPYAPV